MILIKARFGRSIRTAALALVVAALLPAAGLSASRAVDIIDLHHNTSQGVPASPYTIGTQVTVTGVATVGHGTFTYDYLDVYVQDETAGIMIYSPSVPFQFQIGDSVTVTGEIEQYRGMTEIAYSSHTLHTSGATVPTPMVVTCDDVENAFLPDYSEPNEGRLVRLNNVSWTGTWPTGSGAITLHDGTGSCTLYIDMTTGIQNMTPPTGPFDVVGVIKQYAGFSPPYTSDYEILPRTPDDFYLLPGPQILDGPRETDIQHDQVTIHVETDTPTTAVVRYGETSSHEMGEVTDGITDTVHDIVVPGLDAATIYHYEVTVENQVGQSTTPDQLFCSASAPECTGEIICLFNETVDHAFAGATPALGNQDLTTWIIERIDAAQATIDVCLYSFDLQNVADALITAHDRGVTVRFIYDDRDTYQTQVQRLISNGIPVIDDSFGPNNGEGLMHNKFWIFDAASAVATEPWVVSGSWNITQQGTYTDQQNVVLVQDQALARVFTEEFNEMWGSAIWLPNPDNSRFGSNKTDNTPKLFNVSGVPVEVYFAPSDAWLGAMIEEVREAHSSINFCILSFTRYDLTNEMEDRFTTIPGFAVRGVFDSGESGNQYSQYWDMSGVGSYPWNPPADVWFDAETGLLHHKYMLIDAQNAASDPVLITGSANWSTSAYNENDENVLIFHDADVANQYLQEFAERYHAAGGSSLEPSAVDPREAPARMWLVGPSPARLDLTMRFSLASGGPVTVDLFGPDGRLVERVLDRTLAAGEHRVRWEAAGEEGLVSGVYFVRLTTPEGVREKRVAVVR